MRFNLKTNMVRSGVLVAALAALSACSVDDLLTVDDPDVATPISVQDRSALPALRAGAIGDLALAIAGSGNTEDGMIQYTALFTDEFQWAETFPTRQQIDMRNIEVVNATMETLFSNIQRARASAERAAAAYTQFEPGLAARSEMYSLAAFSYVLIGEAYCSGVPFSRVTATGATEFGMPLTTAQIFERAVQLFDSALATAPATGSIRHLAQVGKARALLNLNRPADARTAVAGVPTTFTYNLEYSENSARQQNGVFVVTHINRRFTTLGNEGINGLPYNMEGDPRVVAPRGTGNQATGFDGATPLYLEQKYPSRTAPVPLATGIEARLIEAEADLRSGASATAFLTLNALRSTVTGLQPLVPAATPAGQVDQLFKERAYWLWLTSHRLGDLRRLVRQYNRNPESVFPTGAFFKGGTYGSDVNFPVPFSEQNNPNFQACIDRNA